jgi:FkbM family methyltransferase
MHWLINGVWKRGRLDRLAKTFQVKRQRVRRTQTTQETRSQTATKSIKLVGISRQLEGISDTDPYFSGIGNNFEAAFIDLCKRSLAPDAICLDIGTNIGVTALILSAIALKGKVYCFEPSPTVFPILSANITRNRCLNVEVKQIAIADSEGMVSFEDNSAYGYISATGKVQVPTSTVATVIRALGLERLDFVKIDVEGLEFKILKSGYEALKRFDPLIYFEFNTWCLVAHSRTNPVAFLGWLFDHFQFVGKVAYTSPKQPSLVQLRRKDLLHFLCENMLSGCINDLVASVTYPKFMLAYILHNFRTHNDVHARYDDALSFVTPPSQWHYAVSVNCPSMAAGSAIQLDVRVDKGAVGFGLNDPTFTRYLSDEIIVRQRDGRKKIKIILAEDIDGVPLVARNMSGDGASSATLFSFEIVK